jgi:hypothetical protein
LRSAFTFPIPHSVFQTLLFAPCFPAFQPPRLPAGDVLFKIVSSFSSLQRQVSVLFSSQSYPEEKPT